jgi:hypothetical protein
LPTSSSFMARSFRSACCHPLSRPLTLALSCTAAPTRLTRLQGMYIPQRHFICNRQAASR